MKPLKGGSLSVAKLTTLKEYILVLRECIWNLPVVSLVLPDFDDSGSLGSPPHQVNASQFLAWNMESGPKPTVFSSVLLFQVFLSFLFS